MWNRFRSSALVLMAAHVLLTSFGFLFAKIGLGEFPALVFGFWRFIFGLTGLGIVLLAKHERIRIDRGDWPRFILLAFVAVPLNQLVYLAGLRHTLPSHASLLYACTVAFALILSVLFGYEKLRPMKAVAILVSLSGVAVVAVAGGEKLLHTETFFGDILVIIAVVAWAVYTVFAKPMVSKYGPVQATVICLVLGSAMGLPFLIKPALDMDYSTVTWRGWSGVLYGGFFLTTGAYLVWFALLKRVDPSQVAILTTPQPVVTTALSIWFLGETLRTSLIVGAVLVIGGVVMMEAPALYRRTFQGERR